MASRGLRCFLLRCSLCFIFPPQKINAKMDPFVSKAPLPTKGIIANDLVTCPAHPAQPAQLALKRPVDQPPSLRACHLLLVPAPSSPSCPSFPAFLVPAPKPHFAREKNLGPTHYSRQGLTAYPSVLKIQLCCHGWDAVPSYTYVQIQ